MPDLVAVTKGEGVHLAHVHTLDDSTIYLTLCGNDFTGSATVFDVEVDCRRCRQSGAAEYRNLIARLSDVRRQEDSLVEDLTRLTKYLGLGQTDVQARSERKGAA